MPDTARWFTHSLRCFASWSELVRVIRWKSYRGLGVIWEGGVQEWSSAMAFGLYKECASRRSNSGVNHIASSPHSLLHLSDQYGSFLWSHCGAGACLPCVRSMRFRHSRRKSHWLRQLLHCDQGLDESLHWFRLPSSYSTRSRWHQQWTACVRYRIR